MGSLTSINESMEKATLEQNPPRSAETQLKRERPTEKSVGLSVIWMEGTGDWSHR